MTQEPVAAFLEKWKGDAARFLTWVASCTRNGTAGIAAPVLVQNSLSWARTEWARAEDGWLRVIVPPMGYTVVDAAEAPDAYPLPSASADRLENDVLRVRSAGDGSIVSIEDKRAGREVIPEGEAANRLAVYVDLGNAWDFQMDYAGQTPRTMALVSSRSRVERPRAVLEQVYRAAAATVRFGFPHASVAEVDLMEEHPRPLKLRDGAVALGFRPFEIVSLRVATP